MSRQRVGIVGDEGLADAVETAGADPVVGTAGQLGSVTVAVAVGERAVVSLARGATEAPVIPVEAGRGVRSIPRSSLVSVLERFFDGDASTERFPIVATRGPTESVRAIFDVALMAAEPARISEFSIRCGDEQVDQFRADGVVVSTPAGSVGYNRSADGPIVALGTDVVAVVPIAPFATHADRWVLPTVDVTLAVERDETPVELLVDGRTEATIARDDPVGLDHVDDLEIVIASESGSFF